MGHLKSGWQAWVPTGVAVSGYVDWGGEGGRGDACPQYYPGWPGANDSYSSTRTALGKPWRDAWIKMTKYKKKNGLEIKAES